MSVGRCPRDMAREMVIMRNRPGMVPLKNYVAHVVDLTQLIALATRMESG
jgi:hypothetical protein